jgi:hypothetical protein
MRLVWIQIRVACWQSDCALWANEQLQCCAHSRAPPVRGTGFEWVTGVIGAPNFVRGARTPDDDRECARSAHVRLKLTVDCMLTRTPVFGTRRLVAVGRTIRTTLTTSTVGGPRTFVHHGRSRCERVSKQKHGEH